MDDSVAVGFAVLGSPVLLFLTRIIGSIAHVSPSLKFNELVVSNFFGVPDKLVRTLSISFANQTLAQTYKVVIYFFKMLYRIITSCSML